MSKRKAFIYTTFLTFVICVVAKMLYEVEFTNGLNLGKSISSLLAGWYVGGKLIDFYNYVLNNGI